jgi:hypothetical protein
MQKLKIFNFKEAFRVLGWWLKLHNKNLFLSLCAVSVDKAYGYNNLSLFNEVE